MRLKPITKLLRLTALCLLPVLVAINPLAAQNTPYPIIFVHGINSDDASWGKQDNKFDDIVDHLAGAGLKFGGKIAITLNYKRSAEIRSVAKEDDVKLFTNPPVADFYTINFNVHANGKTPIVHKLGPIVFKPSISTSGGVTASGTQFNVTYANEFNNGDIIRVENEFMQIAAVSGSKLTVTRGIFNSTAVKHGTVTVYNLSNLSNQAAISRQGYGLKLAIDAIKQKTGATKVVLLGHSMGGLAIREYIRLYSNNDIAKIITIGTPHYGTNITDLSPSLLQLINIDGKSDAVRDLRATMPGTATPGLYLFGGNENIIKNSPIFYNADVDANGVENGTVSALNSTENLLSLINIPKTWIASSDDGLVPLQSQYINATDTLMINKFHTDETSDYYSLLRGLDEPAEIASAYSIAENSTTKGFITINKNNQPIDIDAFKITLKSPSALSINITANKLGGIKKILLTDGENNITEIKLNSPVTDTLPPGTYYINIGGHASKTTHKYPYSLVTAVKKITPAASLAYGTPDFNPKPEYKGVVYISSNPNVATVVKNKIHITGTGFTTITGKLGNAKLSGVLEITKAKLTIKADDKVKAVGQDNPTLTATYTGFVYGEKPANLTRLPEFITTANIISPEGAYPITAGGALSNNYVITYLPGTLTVTGKPATSMAGNVADIRLNQAISPNADGVNDYLQIENINRYPENTVLITNSKGIKVFETTGYDNDTKRFEGLSNITNQRLPEGTYFYVVGYQQTQKSGYVVIKY
ncbi:hypothetical protein DJ568_10445 [Mucilaginibacter hurinus]|uniref:MBG domain-containing protein n=1 Tax=Mucilaginibacter hurinus TaxID=2201324 RepID=A0A367GNK2_9SPHI|nr:alpha/beta fold hydrolase [Mucilaginibacter hurinus]RCH54890.1 hypothetical protein DJ568_10445 [Mucilaginibacter hurinus]